MDELIVPTLFDYALSDLTHPDRSVTLAEAETLFSFFHTLFNDICQLISGYTVAQAIILP